MPKSQSHSYAHQRKHLHNRTCCKHNGFAKAKGCTSDVLEDGCTHGKPACTHMSLPPTSSNINACLLMYMVIHHMYKVQYIPENTQQLHLHNIVQDQAPGTISFICQSGKVKGCDSRAGSLHHVANNLNQCQVNVLTPMCCQRYTLTCKQNLIDTCAV